MFYNWRHSGFSFLVPLQTITTSACFVNQSTSGCLPALIAPGYQLMGELTRQYLHFCAISSECYLQSCMLMLLNCLLQLLQAELQTWLCGFGSLWHPASATAIVAVAATTTVLRMVLIRSLPHTGINHQPIQSLTFHSIEPSLGQSSAQDVSTPKLVTAWAATTHKVQDISLHQGANNLGGEIFVNAQT